MFHRNLFGKLNIFFVDLTKFILPILNFIKVDEDLIRYNNIYHSYDFYENKFPNGYDNIPSFDKIIINIVENSKNNNPLKEYNSRINK